MTLSGAFILADEPQQPATQVEKRLFKIELNIAFKQYKKLSTQLSEMRLEDGSPQAGDLPDKEKKLRSQQEAFLETHVEELKHRILEMGKKMEKMEASKKDK
jgi:hypothetical protein